MEKRSQIQTTSSRIPSIEPSPCTPFPGSFFTTDWNEILASASFQPPVFFSHSQNMIWDSWQAMLFVRVSRRTKIRRHGKEGGGKTRTNMLNIKMQKKRGMVDDITRKRKPSLTFSTIFSRYMWARSKLRRAKLRENSFRSGASHFGDTKDMQMGD